jgi:DNA-binding LacI/PurR family transcriptional regulator
MQLLMGMMRERARAADVVLPVELIVRASTARPRG